MRPLVLVLLLAVSVGASGQEKLVESIEVRVVNIDVVVTDRDGKPVTGLTAKDFEILENKRTQAITNFYEVRDGTAALPAATDAVPAPKPRHFLLFIDNRAMHPVLRKHVSGELRRFIDEQMQPQDQASVLSWDRVLDLIAPLTSDKAILHAAIDKVANTGSPAAAKSDFSRVQQTCTQNLQMARSGRMPMKVAYDHCVGEAGIEAQRLLQFSRMLLTALDSAMSVVAGVEGKKVLLLAGTELPVKPGLDMYQWANRLFGPYLTGFDAPMAHPPLEDERTQRDLLEKLGRSANAYGVTLYTISALMPTDSVSATSPTGIIDGGAEFLRSENTEISHETLARLTGGLATPISRLKPMLDRLATDLASYYSLGYRPAADVKGDRAITVKTKNRSYVVRSRQTYAAKSLDDQMADRVVANIFTPMHESDWTVELRTGKPERVERGKYSVPIEIVAAPTVTLLPQNEQLVGGFTVFVAVGNDQGALSTTFRQPNAIRIQAAEERGFRSTPLIFTASLTLREGTNLLSVGVVDQVSNAMGFARATVVTSPQ
jgi:VWFA-related protein